MAERLLLLCCGLGFALGAPADDEAPPDMAFLEYLGMWEESDEEWLLHEQMEEASADARSETAPEGETTPEKEDES